MAHFCFHSQKSEDTMKESEMGLLPKWFSCLLQKDEQTEDGNENDNGKILSPKQKKKKSFGILFLLFTDWYNQVEQSGNLSLNLVEFPI